MEASDLYVFTNIQMIPLTVKHIRHYTYVEVNANELLIFNRQKIA